MCQVYFLNFSGLYARRVKELPQVCLPIGSKGLHNAYAWLLDSLFSCPSSLSSLVGQIAVMWPQLPYTICHHADCLIVVINPMYSKSVLRGVKKYHEWHEGLNETW